MKLGRERFWGDRIARIGNRICKCLLFCVLACLLTGCHGSKGMQSFEVPEEFDESKQYEITFWAKNDTNVAQVAVYKKAIEDFQQLYPNITVNMRLYTDYGRIYNDVITNIATNTTPNVCITYPDHIATYLTGQNSVVALDELFSNEKYGLGGSALKYEGPTREEMISEFLDGCIVEGKYYAIPYMRSTEACYINKTYVEALGYEVPDVLTWDYIWEVAEAATKMNDDETYVLNGQNVMIPFIYKSTDNMMIQMIRQKGYEYSKENGEILLFNDNTKELLYTVADHVKTGAFSTFKISSYPANFLNAGQCVFAIDSTAGASWMGMGAPLSDIPEEKKVEFETAVRMVPQFDPENPQMISQGPSICIFNKADADEVLASWIFTQYLLTNEVQNGYAMTEGYVPVTVKAQNSEEYQSYLNGTDAVLHYDVKIAATKLLLEHTKDTFVTPVFNGSASLRDASGQLIENVAKSVRRKKTIDEAFMKELFEDVASLHRLNTGVAEGDVVGEQKKDLGPLPTEAKILLGTLGVTWLGILLYFVYEKKKKIVVN
ncbi:MAG: extracellular solute-binding protein [Lachnospiraceae bacterium]|nr:extracellular solute-binding protein [Lachnospiraceae bacterium]